MDPIEEFIKEYEERFAFPYINFEKEIPIKVIWWGIKRWSIVQDIKTGQPKKVVQLLVRDTSDNKHKIISTASYSLLKQLSKIQNMMSVKEGWGDVIGVMLVITQMKKKKPSGDVMTTYSVKNEGELRISLQDKETEQTFLYGEIEEIE
jgi:hypothetical protein